MSKLRNNNTLTYEPIQELKIIFDIWEFGEIMTKRLSLFI